MYQLDEVMEVAREITERLGVLTDGNDADTLAKQLS
jgi:hypothetical protein